MYGGEFDLFGVIRFGLELVDVVGILERVERQVAEVLLQYRNAAEERLLALESRRFRATFDVGVEERGHVLRRDVSWLSRSAGATWIASGLDLPDEEPFPIAG